MAYQNFYASKLYAAIGSSDTTITVETPPSIPSGYAVIEARNATKREIIKFTGVSGTQLTGVLRGQGETDATDHVKNALIEINVVAENLQELLDAFESYVATTSDWRNVLVKPSITANLGNRRHTVRFTGVDYTSILTKGSRILVPRTTSVGAGSTDFNTAEYGTKTSPAGMSFTQFTFEAWVKVDSFPSTNAAYFLGRRNTTEGWMIRVNPSGQIEIYAANAGAAWDTVRTTESIPRDRWVHIAAKIAPATASGEIYFDGAIQAATYSNGTATSIAHVAAAPLCMGAEYISGAAYGYNGAIRDMRLWSTFRTADEIRDNMNNELTGSETGLVGYWKLRDDLNDSTANANHFNPFSGLVGGGLDEAPMSDTEYAMVYDTPVYSGGDTTCTVATGSFSVFPSNFGDIMYSTAYAPLGLPDDLREGALRYQDYNGYEIIDYGSRRTALKKMVFETGAIAASGYVGVGAHLQPTGLRGDWAIVPRIAFGGNAPFLNAEFENTTIYIRNVSTGTVDPGSIYVTIFAQEVG